MQRFLLGLPHVPIRSFRLLTRLSTWLVAMHRSVEVKTCEWSVSTFTTEKSRHCCSLFFFHPVLIKPQLLLASMLISLAVFFCGFEGQLAAVASYFCHKWMKADWFLNTWTDRKRSRLEPAEKDEQDFRTKISAALHGYFLSFIKSI